MSCWRTRRSCPDRGFRSTRFLADSLRTTAYGAGVSVPESAAEPRDGRGQPDVAALIPTIRRIVAARVHDHAAADDLVEETLVRVLAPLHRAEPGMLEPYAIVTARNVVATMWQQQDRQRRNQHRVVDLR